MIDLTIFSVSELSYDKCSGMALTDDLCLKSSGFKHHFLCNSSHDKYSPHVAQISENIVVACWNNEFLVKFDSDGKLAVRVEAG